MSSCKILKERQLSLLLEIGSLMLGKTPEPVGVPFFRPHPPKTPPSKKQITRTSRRRARTAELTVRDESSAYPDRQTTTPSPDWTSKTKRKAGTDQLLTTNSDPKIREWLKRKEIERRRVQRQKRREEKKSRSEVEAEARAKEERTKVAQEKYIEWSVKKLGEFRAVKQRRREREDSIARDGVVLTTNDKVYDEWLAKKKVQEKEKQRTDRTSPTSETKCPEEEKRQHYDHWLKSKKRLDKVKATGMIQEEQEKQKLEEMEKKLKEEEKARRLSYDDWLKRKQGKERESVRQRKLELKKDGHIDEVNPFSDIARDLLIKRRMDKDMMKKRVLTGITRPRVERRLSQTNQHIDATDFLREYVEQIQLSQLEQEDGVKPPVKVAWRDSSQRPEPQGSEAPDPVSFPLKTGTKLSLVCVSVQQQDCSQAVPDLHLMTVNGDRNGATVNCESSADHRSPSGDTSPMTNVV